MQFFYSDIQGAVNHIARFDLTLSKRVHLLSNTFASYLKVSNLFEQKNYCSVNGEIANPLLQRTIGLSYLF